MSIIRRHSTAFARQIEEAILISHGTRDNILNSKKKNLGEAIPRLQIEVKDKVKQTDFNGKKLEPTGIKRNQPTLETLVKPSSKRSRLED